MNPEAFSLNGRVVIITGGAGTLGVRHAEAVAEAGGCPVIGDIDGDRAAAAARNIAERLGADAIGVMLDVTKPESVTEVLDRALGHFGHVDALVNNAANDPKVAVVPSTDRHWSRLEEFPLEVWESDLAVGLKGAFLCSKVVGTAMAGRGSGVIVNVASDLGVIAPDQRLYRQDGLEDNAQPVKPVTYSVVKTGLIGLTRYLATYWADRGVRVNAISPGGVYTDQPEEFVVRLNSRIPLGRMANVDEYKAAIVFLLSDASSYMTGANLIVDGGRSCW